MGLLPISKLVPLLGLNMEGAMCMIGGSEWVLSPPNGPYTDACLEAPMSAQPTPIAPPQQGDTEFCPVPGYPAYCVGSDGSVWSLWCRAAGGKCAVGHQWRRMKLFIDGTGYRFVRLYRDGRSRGFRVHRLVLEAFVGPAPPGMEGCHYPDHNKANNRLGNLRWDTHAENSRDGRRDLQPPATKRCHRCGRELTLSEFYRRKRYAFGLDPFCKPCRCRQSADARSRRRALRRQEQNRHN